MLNPNRFYNRIIIQKNNYFILSKIYELHYYKQEPVRVFSIENIIAISAMQ